MCAGKNAHKTSSQELYFFLVRRSYRNHRPSGGDFSLALPFPPSCAVAHAYFTIHLHIQLAYLFIYFCFRPSSRPPRSRMRVSLRSKCGSCCRVSLVPPASSSISQSICAVKLLADSAFSHLCLGNADAALRAMRRFCAILKKFPGIMRRALFIVLSYRFIPRYFSRWVSTHSFVALVLEPVRIYRWRCAA